MSIQTPEALFLLLLLPVVAFILVRSYERGRKQLARLAGEWRNVRLQPIYLLKSFFAGAALILGLLFLILALAGLRWGVTPVEASSTGLDAALVIDVSRSMLAQDQKPNRLNRAVQAAHFIADSLPGARFSLTVFKGGAVTLVPLTRDHHNLSSMLENLDPNQLTAPGSQMEDGLVKGLKTLAQPSSRKRVLILISDGENREGNPLSIIKAAQDLETSIYCLGVGTTDGGPIPLSDGSLVKDGFGNPVITRLNPGLLESLAASTGGRSRLFTDNPALTDLVQPLEVLSNPAAQSGVNLEPVNRYRLFLLLAILAFVVFLGIRGIKWQKQL